MRKSKFTESQIVATLKQIEGGRQVKGVCAVSWAFPMRRTTSENPSTVA
ncbi:hypothetical protein FHT15_002581 [Xanthomonas campestris]|nr:hypothetical protein [Xanthomonas euroxanthea]